MTINQTKLETLLGNVRDLFPLGGNVQLYESWDTQGDSGQTVCVARSGASIAIQSTDGGLRCVHVASDEPLEGFDTDPVGTVARWIREHA